MPLCPRCRKAMKKKEHLSFTYALQIAIDNAVRSAACLPPKPTEWACVGMVDCQEHKRWEKEKEEYDKQMSARQKVMIENERRIFKKKVPPPPKPLPPEPPKKLPCVNNWEYQGVKTGPMGAKMTKRKSKKFFLYDEYTRMITPKQNF